jgi:hypothetical protein
MRQYSIEPDMVMLNEIDVTWCVSGGWVLSERSSCNSQFVRTLPFKKVVPNETTWLEINFAWIVPTGITL